MKCLAQLSASLQFRHDGREIPNRDVRDNQKRIDPDVAAREGFAGYGPRAYEPLKLPKGCNSSDLPTFRDDDLNIDRGVRRFGISLIPDENPYRATRDDRL